MIRKLFAIAALSFAFASTSYAGIFPSVVPSLDLNNFLGRWYEVASTHPSFQEDCVCVTADYKLLENKKVQVVNSCRKVTPEGELSVANGSAETTNNPAKLNVSFGGFNLPFSNYWVVDLADDYRYAVISTPFRTPVWILSRTPEIAQADLDGIYARLKDHSFWTSRITPTQQAGCSYTDEPQ